MHACVLCLRVFWGAHQQNNNNNSHKNNNIPILLYAVCKVELLHSRHRIKMAAGYRVRVRD